MWRGCMIEPPPSGALGLGTPIREFTVGRAKVDFLTIISLGFAALAVLFLVSLLFLVQVSPAQRTEAIVFDSAFGMPVVALLGLLMSRLVNTYGLRVLLYPAGVVLWRRGENTVIRWEQI